VILPNEKLIYIHIPKTGGISVEDFILGEFGYKRSVLNLTDGVGNLRISTKNDGYDTLYPYMHHTLPQVINIANKINIEVDNTWNLFSIVRNPYYKFISELFFVLYTPLPFHYHTLPQVNKTQLVNNSIDEYFAHPTKNNFHSNHSLPQYKFFEGVDLNYKIFKFEEGLENIMVKLGFEVNNNFPHQLDMFKLHSTPRPNYKDVLTPYLVEIVNEKYAKDFEVFGYDMLSPLDI
jgi:hypothetical protein